MSENEEKKLTPVHMPPESMRILEAVKSNFEQKLEENGVPVELSRQQVVTMALKNELKRQDAVEDERERHERGRDGASERALDRVRR